MSEFTLIELCFSQSLMGEYFSTHITINFLMIWKIHGILGNQMVEVTSLILQCNKNNNL